MGVKAKSLQSSPKPVEVKRGNISVKVYAGQNRAGGKIYPQFTLVYYDGPQRTE